MVQALSHGNTANWSKYYKLKRTNNKKSKQKGEQNNDGSD